MIPAAVAPKVARLIALLATDNDGELLAAIAALRRTLAAHDADLNDLAAMIDGGCGSAAAAETPSWGEVARWCRRFDDYLNDRESVFVSDMAGRLFGLGQPTEKQAAWLLSIHAKLKAQGLK